MSYYYDIQIRDIKNILDNINEQKKASENSLWVLEVSINHFIESFLKDYIENEFLVSRIMSESNIRDEMIKLCVLINKLLMISSKTFPRDALIKTINEIVGRKNEEDEEDEEEGEEK